MFPFLMGDVILDVFPNQKIFIRQQKCSDRIHKDIVELHGALVGFNVDNSIYNDRDMIDIDACSGKRKSLRCVAIAIICMNRICRLYKLKENRYELH